MWQFLKGSQNFKAEIELWQQEGIITAEQLAKLKAKYELDAPPPWYKRTSFVLQGVALLLAAMGFFLLIAMNWETLPIFVRTLIVLLPLLGSYAVAWYQYRKENISGAELAMLLASLLLGANIALQAQIYHISAYFPDGVLWWILGTLPVIYFFRSSLIAVIFQGLFIIWLQMQLQFDQFAYWGIIMFAAFSWFLYRNPNSVHLIFAFVSGYLFLSNIFQSFIYTNRYDNFVFSLLFTTIYALMSLSKLKILQPQYSETFILRLQQLFTTGIFFVLYAFTFSEFNKDIANHTFEVRTLLALAIFYVLALTIWAWKTKFTDRETSIFFLVVGIFLSMPLLNRNEDTAFWYMVLCNILLFSLIIYKIYIGIQHQEKAKFMWGIGYLVVWAISRYIVLFGENYLFTGLVFIACSLGIFAVNRLWNKKFGE
jgi:hypothetical protein